jgi:hypothetical protein
MQFLNYIPAKPQYLQKMFISIANLTPPPTDCCQGDCVFDTYDLRRVRVIIEDVLVKILFVSIRLVYFGDAKLF